ncbi:MAG TPA: ATP-grasp domain-containing protein [Candidatus Dormibacteraeota bacterium]|nr:ATP-grasp domain-containing protein [Candidatus Dormibacteraeota bacterium]
MPSAVVRPAKRLLVVGASPMRSGAFATWREMGLDIVLVDGYSTARYEDLAHEFWPLDPRDGSADLESIRSLARGCDGITTLSDDSQRTVAVIAEELGLPGVGSAAATAARSKTLQRELWERAGIPVPRWRKVETVEDVREFYAGGSRSAVLKPVDGAGGVGALRVENLDEAARHWPIVRLLSPARTAVIEDYVEGREVCVDAIVTRGAPVFVSVADCEHLAMIGFLCTAHNYAADQPDLAMATAMIQQIVDALGIGPGNMHVEFKIKDGRWVPIEMGLRPGGAFVPELTVRVRGVDIYEAQARLALGLDPPVPGMVRGQPEAAYAQSRYLVGEGRVRRFVTPGTIVRGLPDVKVVNQQAAPGQRTRVPVSEANRAGYAYGWSDDRERLDDQLREAIARLGKEMGLVVHGNDRGAVLAP